MPASVAFPKSSFVSTNAAIRDWKTERGTEHGVYESSVKRFATLGHAY